MRRLANIAGGLLGLLALGALVVTLALTFGGLQREPKPASQAFQSPVETPTQPPYPAPQTPTPQAPITPYPSPAPSPTPTATATPIVLPNGWYLYTEFYILLPHGDKVYMIAPVHGPVAATVDSKALGLFYRILTTFTVNPSPTSFPQGEASWR